MITASYDPTSKQFRVSAGGLDADFSYDQVVDYVQEVRRRDPELTWAAALRDVARQISEAARAYMSEEIPLDILLRVVGDCLFTLFNKFVDTMINAAFDIITYGIDLVKRFINWLFSFF